VGQLYGPTAGIAALFIGLRLVRRQGKDSSTGGSERLVSPHAISISAVNWRVARFLLKFDCPLVQEPGPMWHVLRAFNALLRLWAERLEALQLHLPKEPSSIRSFCFTVEYPIRGRPHLNGVTAVGHLWPAEVRLRYCPRQTVVS